QPRLPSVKLAVHAGPRACADDPRFARSLRALWSPPTLLQTQHGAAALAAARDLRVAVRLPPLARVRSGTALRLAGRPLRRTEAPPGSSLPQLTIPESGHEYGPARCGWNLRAPPTPSNAPHCCFGANEPGRTRGRWR